MKIFIFVLFFFVVSVSDCAKNNSVTGHADDGCVCKTYSCGCCVTMSVPEIWLNDTACVNVAYLPDDYGISVNLTIDGKAIISETIAARSPPPICVEPPYMEKVMHICLRFYDLDITSSVFHGCALIEMKLFYLFKIKEIELGCFNLDLVKLKHMRQLEKILKSKSNVTLSNVIPDSKELLSKNIFTNVIPIMSDSKKLKHMKYLVLAFK